MCESDYQEWNENESLRVESKISGLSLLDGPMNFRSESLKK